MLVWSSSRVLLRDLRSSLELQVDSSQMPTTLNEQKSYLDDLNEAQKEAVITSPDQPLQILAGPGSGK